MGLLFSKRHDFLTYEKSLEHISQRLGKLAQRRNRRKTALQGYKQKLLTACFISLVPCIAWVAWLRQHQFGELSAGAYFTRTTTPFIIPVALYLASYALYQIFLLLDRHEALQAKKLTEARKKLIKELKDSTNFEKTMALLKKYDPEAHVPPPLPPVPSPGLKQQQLRSAKPFGTPPPGGPSKGSTLLSSALDSVSQLATNLMGDNPALLEELRRAQTSAQRLQQENEMLRRQLGELCTKYDEVPVFLSISEPSAAQGAGAGRTSAPVMPGTPGPEAALPPGVGPGAGPGAGGLARIASAPLETGVGEAGVLLGPRLSEEGGRQQGERQGQLRPGSVPDLGVKGEAGEAVKGEVKAKDDGLAGGEGKLRKRTAGATAKGEREAFGGA